MFAARLDPHYPATRPANPFSLLPPAARLGRKMVGPGGGRWGGSAPDLPSLFSSCLELGPAPDLASPPPSLPGSPPPGRVSQQLRRAGSAESGVFSAPSTSPLTVSDLEEDLRAASALLACPRPGSDLLSCDSLDDLSARLDDIASEGGEYTGPERYERDIRWVEKGKQL